MAPRLVDLASDYADLLADGLAVWPRTGSGQPGVEAWVDRLVAEARSDGLRAGLVWFHHDDIDFHPCVQLFRPDGGRYDYPGEGKWPSRLEPPPREPARVGLRPLIERDWGDRLERARARANAYLALRR
jgi:hypothetical protein